MDFAKQIEYNRRLLVEDIFRRLEAALQPLVDAVNDFFAVLFSRRLPADWREQWRALIAEQEAAGYRVDPKCVQEFEDWIEAWARYCELLPVAETQAVSPKPAAVEPPPVVSRALPRPTQTQIREQFFDQKLAEAQRSLDEIKRLLDELGGRLDAAKLDETIGVDSDVERCEALIWRYNDSLISARDAWLRDDLSGEANVRLLQMLAPASFGLPLFTDEQQAQEAMRQGLRISERLGQRNVTMNRVVAALEWTNVGLTATGILVGGGILYGTFKEGGKWAVIKTLAVAAAAAAAEQGVEAGMRAAGASEETIRGARLAAAVIAFILLRRHNRAAAAKAETPSPSNPATVAAGRKGGNPKKASGKKLPSGESRRRAGIAFNKAREHAYTYNEVPIVNPRGGRPNYLDSYDPVKGEIVSRKISQLSEIKLTSAKKYLRELAAKYPPGAVIADVPSAKGLAGQQLEGNMFLEVPPQWKAIPRAVLREAAHLEITIRDSNGRVYHAD